MAPLRARVARSLQASIVRSRYVSSKADGTHFAAGSSMMKAFLVVVVLGLATPVLNGQTTTAEKADKLMAGGKLPDENFVIKAAYAGMAEVELGKLAVVRANSEEVRKFGRRMVDDHGRTNDELKILAQNKRIALPAAVDPHGKAIHDRLTRLSGAAFDQAYMEAMLVDHQKAVNDFRVQARAGKDADVKGWAAKTLPTLEDHVKLAQKTNSAGGTSGTRTKK
jgi:putative membrane protein